MNNYEVKKWEFENGKVNMKIPDNPMQDPMSVSIISTKIKMEINDIVNEFAENIPFDTSTLEITINPISKNVINKYYSFSGIQDILNKLLKYRNRYIEDEILNIDTYLKVYLIKLEQFTIPSIKIEIVLLKKLSDKSYDIINDFLKNELIKLIGNPGSIQTYEITHPLKLQHILNIPLLLGHPQFKQEGIYKSLGFSKCILNELNYLFTNSLIKFDYEEIMMDVFGHLKLVIENQESDKREEERMKNLLIDMSIKGDLNIDFEGNLDEIRYIISQKNEEDSGIPF